MPICSSSFKPAVFLRTGHLQTVLPALLRRARSSHFERKRLELDDDDFLDLDLWRADQSALAIVSHGLEGSSTSQYVGGISHALHSTGYDILAWNMRGCSGEVNRLIASYHSGFTADLDRVITFACTQLGYAKIVLIGFSVGGNITLKYLGERAVPNSAIKAAVTFSVPCDLASSARQLALRENCLYMGVFLRSLFDKLKIKQKRFGKKIDLSGIEKIRTFAEYDGRFIAPLHGFQSAEDYWEKASSLPFLSNIHIPTLLLSSQDDSFLAADSLPQQIAATNPNFHLEITRYGGHVGFMYSTPWGRYYSEQRALEFLKTWVQ